MSKKNMKAGRLPSLGARIPAAVFALLLTGAIWAAVLSLLGIQLLTSRGLHERAALAGDAVELQMTRIENGFRELADEFGFEPETLISLVSREKMENLDREVVRWWTESVATGRIGEKPTVPLEGAEEALKADSRLSASVEPLLLPTTAEKITARAGRIVWKSAVHVRDDLLTAGVQIAGRQINLPEAAELLGKVPLAALAAALLFAGLIALCMSRRLQTAGHFIGGAMAAAGLLTALTLLPVRMLNLRGMLAEASGALTAQSAHLERILTLESLGCAALLIIAGVLLMLLAKKEYARHEG